MVSGAAGINGKKAKARIVKTQDAATPQLAMHCLSPQEKAMVTSSLRAIEELGTVTVNDVLAQIERW